MRITAVVVTWNSASTIAECLRLLRSAAEHARVELELVVVDNDSRDASREHAALADVLVENGLNAGFAVASNQGFALASGEWILFANPDLRVDAGFFDALARAAAGAEDDVAVLVPELRFSTAPDVVNSRGIAVDALGIPAEIAAGEPADVAPRPLDPFGASGGAACIRASALRRVGAFEPAFFAYLEDVELAWRLRLAGFRAVFVPDAVAYHDVSSTIGEGSRSKSYLVGRNRRLLFALHGPRAAATRLRREVVDGGHMLVQVVLTRSLAPISGRISVLRLRRYVRSRPPRQAAPTQCVPLAARVGIRAALERKLRTRSLMAASPDS